MSIKLRPWKYSRYFLALNFSFDMVILPYVKLSQRSFTVSWLFLEIQMIWL